MADGEWTTMKVTMQEGGVALALGCYGLLEVAPDDSPANAGNHFSGPFRHSPFAIRHSPSASRQ
jgi:hypothetical protein